MGRPLMSLVLVPSEGVVRIMVARDDQSVLHAIAVSVGDDRSDFADALTKWGLASPDDSNEPPREWFG